MLIDPNVVELTSVVFAGLAVVIPIAGITARIAMKPLTETISLLREGRRNDDDLGKRVAVLEERFHDIDRSLKVLVEDADFRRRLAAAPPAATLPDVTASA
jgi:hypothetical protein